jgi:hypothetical protein
VGGRREKLVSSVRMNLNCVWINNGWMERLPRHLEYSALKGKEGKAEGRKRGETFDNADTLR